MRFGKIGYRPLFTDLPYDAEVEWLESTGTQWIDTGILPTVDMSANITLSYQKDSAYPAFGTRSQANSQAFTAALDTYLISTASRYSGQFDDVSANHINFIKPNIGQKFSFYLSKEGGFFDGIMVNNYQSTPHTFTPYGTCYLFGRNDSQNTKASCRIYSFLLAINNILIRDFIPVRINTIGAMYDKISKTLFYNAGTGAFIVGPDKVAGGATDDKRHRTKLIRTSFSKARSRQQLRATSFSAKRNRKEAAI